MKGHILITDDEPALRELFAETLTEAGHTVATAADARAALALLREQSFDTVISDINMPGGDGIEFLRAIHKTDPDLPVVLVTGSPTLESAIQALKHAAVQYLVKPVPGGALNEAVQRALRLRRIALLKREALEYSKPSRREEADRGALNQSLSRAISALWMAYQPIFRASDGGLFGSEALLRSDERGLNHPGAILDAAERLERVFDLSRAVRRNVASAIPKLGGESIFVNIHSLDLRDDQLFSSAEPLSALAPKVVLEITERATLEGIPDVRTKVRTLRDLGFRIAVDDLGAGYAGLTTFAALEPDIVKLDMSLVRNVDREPVKRKLIGSMTGLCRDLGMLVVAEGIETTAERDVVVELGCDLLQGFLLGRPAPFAA